MKEADFEVFLGACAVEGGVPLEEAGEHVDVPVPLPSPTFLFCLCILRLRVLSFCEILRLSHFTLVLILQLTITRGHCPRLRRVQSSPIRR